MPKRVSKRLRETNDMVESIVEATTDSLPPVEPEPVKNRAAVALGKLGGAKGGKARAASLSRSRRTEIAKRAAAARWGKK